nr:bacteriocin [Chryseobacterium sp. RU37D]
MKKLTKNELKAVNGGAPQKYCVYYEWINDVVCSKVPIFQCR